MPVDELNNVAEVSEYSTNYAQPKQGKFNPASASKHNRLIHFFSIDYCETFFCERLVTVHQYI